MGEKHSKKTLKIGNYLSNVATSEMRKLIKHEIRQL